MMFGTLPDDEVIEAAVDIVLRSADTGKTSKRGLPAEVRPVARPAPACAVGSRGRAQLVEARDAEQPHRAL